MIRYLLAFLLLICLNSSVIADEAETADSAPAPAFTTVTTAPPTPTTEITTATGAGIRYTKDRVIHLPKDQNKFFVTIIGDPSDAKFEAIKGWFKNVPELAHLRDETHFNTVTTSQPDFKDRYSTWTKRRPAIFVTTPSGGVVYKATGDNVPMSGQALSRAVNTEFLRRWRERRLQERNANRGRNNADAEDDEAPLDEEDNEDADEQKDAIPDTQPASLDMLSNEVLLALGAVAGIIVIGGLSFVSAVKSHHTKPGK